MTTWFTKNLGDAMLAHPALEQLQELFRQTYGLQTITMFGMTAPYSIS